MAEHLIRLGDVCKVTGFGKTTIYKWMADGSFPRPIAIGKSVRWVSSEVDAWVLKVIALDRGK
ncbi:MAG: AlpA family transcriptional regulator [Ewingella americana]|jgi:prophage regulatory protein|uniref:helix-turn-helix transcriptional regulator n=1 Tax=Ewingella americana TaxID=41202 RepID=UPI0024317F2A|nr:AlpA family transcriptional regulator [Ewingella americana]MCI1680454.1 AlpA family transcriptional regulator [Ewingella americana]MCI1856304.1 AlpA family transcriptional regulator [Ewingella americana]MCI1863979.1 AlpA family transcriptional regulator [Ewingella americana]MCI2142983.1 AlpA family transcriptional regulator [Ewingella americana]MCI2163868.1 AlpA family transcriptional regulator [Ewingella americana]